LKDIEDRRRSLHRDVEDDVDDPRRSLPSKAHVQRSAVSVGFAAGRLTGTRGTSKDDVDHSVLRPRTTSRIDVDHSIVMSRTTSRMHVDHSIVMSRTTSRMHVDHSHRDVEDDVEDARRSLPS
jgi:hypothetical protein